ncbi:C40 family peptidase [Myxococcota bacterium]
MPLTRPLLTAWLTLHTLSVGCSPNGCAFLPGTGAPDSPSAAGAKGPTCRPFSEKVGPLPGVEPRHLTLEFWFEQLKGQQNLDEVLLTPEQIANLNASLQVPREEYYAQSDLLALFDVARMTKEVDERRAWARGKLSSGEYVGAKGAALPSEALAILEHKVDLTVAKPELRVILRDAQIHCAPTPVGFYSRSLDLRLDRNSCSALRAQDVVRVVATWPNGMKLIEGAFSHGWTRGDVPLSPPLPTGLAATFLKGPTLTVHGSPLTVGEGGAAVTVAEGTRLPAADNSGQQAYVATSAGFVTTSSEQGKFLRPTRRELTRRAVLQEAWRFMGTPYGLGDTGGGRDCSRLLLDVFASFDLDLPRHSSWQSKAGSFWVDVERVPEAERSLLFEAAAKKGIVLLHFPGHIMLYLGKNERGQPMVLHALGEYVEPCRHGSEPKGETLVRVKNITVSTLELGRGTSRKALLERITRVTVLGGTPGVELAGLAQLRPVANARIPPDKQCKDSQVAAIYFMPEQPNRRQPLRVVTATNQDPGPAALTLIDPDGERVVPDTVRLGGPPFGQVATLENPKPGKWKAVLADGNAVLACLRTVVGTRRPGRDRPDAGPIWTPRHRWDNAKENLYALFIERLFDYPMEDDRVWKNLHSLLRDPERNILFDYRGRSEDGELELVPDCADLPYVLRAYFAWKVRLPFGYRRCTRGRADTPPTCNEREAGDNLMSRLELPGKGGRMRPRRNVDAFELFVNTQLRSGVHSSSGRTAPKDDKTDFYPVALTREALKPGTVFADPYGHFLVLSDWIPQGPQGSGILVGVDAQPDGTVGQRRFWRGTFLFDADTKGGGAGFKAFRPVFFRRESVRVELGLDDEKSRSNAQARATANQAGASSAIASTAISRKGLKPGDSAAKASRSRANPAELCNARASGSRTSRSGPSNSRLCLSLPSVARSSKMGGQAMMASTGGDEAALGSTATIERVGFLEELRNGELRGSTRFRRFSLQQYQGTTDDFYLAVESLINPRPLDPKTVQLALVDALYEAVTRRVISVSNGENWQTEHPGEVIEMPDGGGIFLAMGAWEDFSTPSRDLRLLIAIDTVLGFSKTVRLGPQRFGLLPSEVSAKVAELDRLLGAELAKRTFSYGRSNGTAQQLSLKDVVARAASLEMAYNPNDCVEIRWGAPAGSPERATCQRHAPPEQREKMQKYRGWFSTRKRPRQ